MPKSEEQKQNERWTKLVTPAGSEPEIEPKIERASVDAYMFLEVAASEAMRRFEGRKIDPLTGVIYHIEDNPPPENDNKLRDRLQDYSDPEEDGSGMNKNFMMYDNSKSSLKKWISGFGLYDQEFSHIPPVSSLLQVQVADRQKKTPVWDLVQE